MVIDVHAHTSDSRLHGLHTDQADLDYLRMQAEKFGIEKIYLMATYFPLKKSGLSNSVLLKRIDGNPIFGCFGSLDMENKFVEGLVELTDLAANKLISGIKIYPGYQEIFLSDPKFDPLFQLAEEYQLPVACHLGELHHCCSRELKDGENYRCGSTHCLLDHRGYLSHPRQFGMMVKRFPKVNFIACHLGNPYFRELRKVMSECDNVYTDFSGQFLSGTNEDSPDYRLKLKAEIDKFLLLKNGPDRLLFGTDFPIQSYEDTFQLLELLNINAEEKEKITRINAEKLNL
ncbi:MAG: amidohydrolase family protein [Candidatus Falkowbacteria bacterium]|nr:amidohydrolase family protein [Candidatus Falkowbacteria bacterium]